MKREESLLNTPIENEFNSRLQRDFCDEDESNSDFEDKSLLSVRISHDDTKDNENELLYQMSEASKNENTMESILNASLKRNKKEVIISELNIEMNSTENKSKKICRNFNFDSVIKKKIFQFNKKINDSKTNRSINQMTPKINLMSAKTKQIFCKRCSHSNSPIKHINCHTSVLDANKKQMMNLPMYKVSSYRVKYHFPCIMNYKQFPIERNAKSKSQNKRKINLKKIHIKNKIHNVNTLLFQNKN